MSEWGDFLESIIGKPVTVDDPFSAGGKPLSWISCEGNPADLCRLIEEESKRTRGLPSPEQVRDAGGFWAHLQLAVHKSGIVSAEIHAELQGGGQAHVVYKNSNLTECRGMKSDGAPDYGDPLSLKSISLGSFSLHVTARKLALGEDSFQATAVSGQTQAKSGSIWLDYAVAHAFFDGGREYPSKALLRLAAKAGQPSYPEFSLSFELYRLRPLEYKGTLSLASGEVSVHYDPDGSVTAIKTKHSGDVAAAKWETVFCLAFSSSSKRVPNIDIPSTLKNMIAAGLGSPADSGKVSVDSLLSYK